MEPHRPKKWQNLIRQCCPLCGGHLEPIVGRGHLLGCLTPGCEFVASRAGIMRILSDETHILRQHLDHDDAIRLENTLKAMREGTGDIEIN